MRLSRCHFIDVYESVKKRAIQIFNTMFLRLNRKWETQFWE